MRLTIIPLTHFPLIKAGDDLPVLITRHLEQQVGQLHATDIVVVAQKVVSKAEDCWVDLTTVQPSAQAVELARVTRKPASLVEAILQDSAEVIRAVPGVLIVEHRLGFICANAGLDQSNTGRGERMALRLPRDPDQSARAIRAELMARMRVAPAVLIIDSHGRAWRFGTVGVTIGLSGLKPTQDLRGEPDLFGRPLIHTEVGLTDQIAAAATLVMGQGAEACPIAVLRGLVYQADETAQAKDVLRPASHDLFR